MNTISYPITIAKLVNVIQEEKHPFCEHYGISCELMRYFLQEQMPTLNIDSDKFHNAIRKFCHGYFTQIVEVINHHE